MKFFDRLKNIFRPEPAPVPAQKIEYIPKSYHDRHPEHKPQAYFANTGYGSGGAKYEFGLSGDGGSFALSHQTTRQNARRVYHGVPQARAVVKRFADTVVDIGLKAEPIPAYNILGITREKAEAWGKDVGERFHLWANSKKSHRARTMTFYQNQRLYQIFQQRDNDIFVPFFYSNSSDLFSPLQIDFIDPNQINGSSLTSSYVNMQTTYDGIIRDPITNEETGFKVFVQDKDGNVIQKTIPARGTKSGRRFMIHGFSPEYANQGRGHSELAHALQEFQDLTSFNLAHIQKAINQASMTMATENDQQDPSDPTEGLPGLGGSGPVSYDAHQEYAAENIAGSRYEYCSIPEATLTRPGIGVFNMAKGDKLRLLEQNTPADSYPEFMKAFTSSISASMSMPIEVHMMQFGQNYSASKAALILFWRVAMILRAEMEADLLNPVFESWLSEEIAAGRVSAPGWQSPILREAWLNCRWHGSPIPNLDPLKEIKATKEAISAGLTTTEREARNYNGSDAASNRVKLEKEFSNLPIPPWNQKQGGQ